jgi:hypothetical protein
MLKACIPYKLRVFTMVQQNSKNGEFIFIIGMISLVFTMATCGFCAYILPYLLFGFVYDVPSFIINWQEQLIRGYTITRSVSAGIIFVSLLVPGILFGFLAYVCAKYLDPVVREDEISNMEQGRARRLKRDVKDTSKILLKLLIIVIMVIVAVEIIEWIIYIEPAIQQEL